MWKRQNQHKEVKKHHFRPVLTASNTQMSTYLNTFGVCGFQTSFEWSLKDKYNPHYGHFMISDVDKTKPTTGSQKALFSTCSKYIKHTNEIFSNIIVSADAKQALNGVKGLRQLKLWPFRDFLCGQGKTCTRKSK